METIAFNASEEICDEFNKLFDKNLELSQERAERRLEEERKKSIWKRITHWLKTKWYTLLLKI